MISPAVAAAAKEASERLGWEWEVKESKPDGAFAAVPRTGWVEWWGIGTTRLCTFNMNDGVLDELLAALHGYTLLAAALAEKGVEG